MTEVAMPAARVRTPLFSVVIPTYNRAVYLRQALASVDAQEFRDFETIVVDDGSTEDLSEVVREFQDRVTFVRQDNSGPGVARNRGAAIATGEYLAFLDSDDVWFPWTLRVYAEAIEANPRPALLSGRLFSFESDGDLNAVRFEPARWQAYPDYFASSRDGLYCGSGHTVVRRDVFLRAGGFTDRRINAEDHDFVMRLGTERGFVHVARPAMVGYRQHGGAMTGNVAQTIEGVRYLLRQEHEGRYPGGRERGADRRRILSQHVRPVSLAALRRGDRRAAWELYRQTLGWHVQLGRFRYLTGFAALAAETLFRRAT
jgi:glycosyltransferase involved in cell wall biosynthesis